MDLFSVVHLSKPKLVTEGVRPLRDGEEPLLESTVGRTMELVMEQPEVESTDVLGPTPLRIIPGATVEPPLPRSNVEATSDSSAPVTHAAQSPPQTGPKAFEGMPVDQLMEAFDWSCAASRASGAARERGWAESSRSFAKNLGGKNGTACQGRARAREFCGLQGKLHECEVFGGGKNNHFAGLDEFRQRVEGLLEKQEEKWLISHGLRLAAMSTLESQEVKQSFGDVVTCALARGKAEAVEELHEKKLLTVPAAQVPGYNDKAYEELVAAMEAMKLLELPHIAQLERDQDYPIDVIMAGLTLARHATEGAEGQPDYFLKPDVAQLQVPIFARPRDILNPFALEREIPLKETLEAHAIRLAKKKGVKGKAILCGVGAAHIPRSDGVPVSVAAVSPKDSELLGKLEEAGDAAYQVGSSGARRCHSI
ncbi:hypothetical protein Tco_0282343 [Tanacetum coccineum]